MQLALSIARKILHREAQIDPLLLTGVVRVALESLNEGTHVRLRTNPQEVSFWRDYFSQASGIRPTPELIGDASLAPAAACWKPISAARSISLETQLKEIEQGFLDLLEQRPRVTGMNAAESAGSLFSPPGGFLHLPLGGPRHQSGRLPGGIRRPVLLGGRRLRHSHLRWPHAGRRNCRLSRTRRFSPCRSNARSASATAIASSRAARALPCAWAGPARARDRWHRKTARFQRPYGAREYWPLRGDAPLPLDAHHRFASRSAAASAPLTDCSPADADSAWAFSAAAAWARARWSA